MHGWLVVDKPRGISSAAVVAMTKRALDAAKAGHAGTLDPEATGLVAVALGEATKTVSYIADSDKTYRFTLRWGAATDSDDAAGEIIAASELRPSEADIRAALAPFRGDILQVPPQVSAVKVGGERAYRRARRGEASELAARPLHVSRLELLRAIDRDQAELELVCGKGGYVRSIGRDLGSALGCLAHVIALRRLRSGPFTIEEAVTPDEMEALRPQDLEARLLPLETALAALPWAPCTEAEAAKIRYGNPVTLSKPAVPPAPGEILVTLSDRALAIGQVAERLFRPTRVFAAGP